MQGMDEPSGQLMSMQASLGKSEDDLSQLQPKTDSFWDVGNYKPVVRRYEDGARLCSDLTKMVQERSDIEAKYAKHMQGWGHKWEDLVSKGPEYGSLECGWKACFQAAERVAEVHREMSEKLQGIAESVQSWKAEHYHKTIMHLKEAKKAEDGFFKAQKPWTKHLQRTHRSRKAFHSACKELDVHNSTLLSAESNPDATKDQLMRIKEKKERAQRDVAKCREKYREKLEDTRHYQSRYIEDMQLQFDKCQQFERERMLYFKSILCNLKGTVDTADSPKLTQVYADYSASLAEINPDDDLHWFSLNAGVDMPYSWPEFEEYVPEPTQTKQAKGSPNNINSQKPTGSHNGIPQLSARTANSTAEGEEAWLEPPPQEKAHVHVHAMHTDRDGGQEEEPESQLMRALYDYSGPDEDDLCFKEGDLIRVMYIGEDGWAEGMMGDKYGYVPLSWLEKV